MQYKSPKYKVGDILYFSDTCYYKVKDITEFGYIMVCGNTKIQHVYRFSTFDTVEYYVLLNPIEKLLYNIT